MNNLMDMKQTISSMEVAEMVETTHKYLLKKIDGRIVKGEKKKGYYEIIAEGQMSPSDFFIPSKYRDSSGKENKCYMITKKGCEFLAHKFNGEKGVLFTARYINRFHEMEEKLQSGKISMVKCEISSEIPRKTVNSCVLPPANKWYYRNKERLNHICRTMHIDLKELYHGVLWYVGQEYDLDAAKKIYKNKTGIYPEYAINIVSFFPELEILADEFLEMVIKKLYN